MIPDPTEPEATSDEADFTIDLDRAFSPLRRLIVYARENPDEVRFFDANAARWLAVAAGVVPADAALTEALGALTAQLDGWDALDRDARIGRIEVLFQEIVRLDSMLGLPLPPRRRPRPRRPEKVEPKPEKGEPKAEKAEKADKPEKSERAERREKARAEARSSEPKPEKVEPKPEKPPEVRPARPVEPPRQPGLDSRLSELGLAPALAAALTASGVESASELQSLTPDGEELLHPIHGAGRELPAGRAAVGGRVRRRWSVVRPDGVRTDHALIQGAGPLVATWTSATPELLRALWIEELAPEARVHLVGRVEGDELFDAEPAVDDGKNGVRLGVYSGVDGRILRAAISRISANLAKLRDPLPESVTGPAKLLPVGEALAEVHQRGSGRGEARRRLAFEEALLVQLGLAWTRFAGGRDRGISHPLAHGLVARLASSHGVEITDAMASAWEDIKRDLRRPSPMMRLLDGPAGTGRWAVAMLAAVQVAESRAQVLVICPDAAAADHRLALVEAMLRDGSLVGRSFSGDVSRASRDALRRGEIHVVFAGPEVIEQGLEFRRLGLVIALERPPYGEVVRRIADGKIGRPDLLVIPASGVTPATVAAAWPHLDVTRMEAVRRGRLHIEVTRTAHRAEAYARAATAVKRHEQVLVVFPLVDGIDPLDLRDALRIVRALEAEELAGAKIGLFHGSMPREDRARVWDDFRHHRLDVLVATASVEDGPGVPRLTHLIVEQADSERPLRIRHFLASLSGARPWAGLIVSDEADASVYESLEALRRADRGPEPVWRLDDARAEPPAPGWRWVDLATDAEVWWEGRRAAHELLVEDPGLRKNPELARLVRERWADWFPSAERPEEDDAEGADDEAGWPCPIPEAGPGGGDRKRRRRRRKRK